MEDLKSLQKSEIENMHNDAKKLKEEFIEIFEEINELNTKKPEIATLNMLHDKFMKLIFNTEEIGKKAGSIFANKNLYKDSSEISKLLYQNAIKVESLKEALIVGDRQSFYKYHSSLKKTTASTEYILSLFIGELISEITENIFKPLIEQKKSKDLEVHITELKKNTEKMMLRVEKCEKKISLMLKRNPHSFLAEDEAAVIKEIIKLHEKNVTWIEPRFIEKNLPISKDRINSILDDLSRYGVLQYKLRGGTTVYKFGEIDDSSKNQRDIHYGSH
ncbi:MAG: hypothetical protein ACXQTP_00500 [Candidatus Methanofastidiosia archaeon]